MYRASSADAGIPKVTNVTQNRNTSHWPGTECYSDAWPYSSDISTFEARRAVGQLARTFGAGLNPPDCGEDADVDPALRYLYAVRMLETALEDIRRDLVAEARTRGVTWHDIGVPLNITKQGAWNQYGDGLSVSRLGQLRDEATTCFFAAKVVELRRTPPSIAAEIYGTTPADRMNYLVRKAIDIISEIRDSELLYQPKSAAALEAMRAVGRKVRRLGLVITADHGMWLAAAHRSGQPEHIDQANYHAPATYLLHVMRLLLLACVSVADEDCADHDRCRAGLDEASRIYANMIFILERADVTSVVPCYCGETWDRCQGACAARD